MPQWKNDKMEKDSSQKKNFAIKSSLYFCSYHISTCIFSKKKGGNFPRTETQERYASSSKPDSRAFCNSWHVDQWSKSCPCLPSSVTRFNGSLLETPRVWKLGGMLLVHQICWPLDVTFQTQVLTRRTRLYKHKRRSSPKFQRGLHCNLCTIRLHATVHSTKATFTHPFWPRFLSFSICHHSSPSIV